LGGQLRVKQLELLPNGIEIADRIPSAEAGDVDQMHEYAGSFQMAQELMSQSLSVVRAFNQPGDVRDDETAIAAQAHDAEIGDKRREGIVGDLRARGRDARDE